ncbi:MAG: type II secretion system protein GspD, partial [Luteolibacter sp.]
TPPPATNAAPAANAGGAAAASSAGEATPVQIVAEPRTNRIFAMGRPVDLIFVEGLVREFDIPTDEKTFFRRKLRFLTVSEFLPIAGDALNRAFSGSSEGGTSGTSSGGRSSATGTNRSTQSSSATGGNSRFGNNNNSSLGGNSSFGGGSRSSTSLGDPNTSSAPESLLVGRTLLVADNITNSIVAQGPPSALEIIQRLLDQIDIKPEQVMISTVIGQLSLIENKEFGIGYLLDSGDIRAGGGGGVPTFNSDLNTFPELDLGSIASSGLRLYGTTGDLSTFVRAIQNKSDFTVLSRPSIFTSNNQKGVISSGERIAIPTEGGTSTGSFSSGTRIQYQDVVLKLEVIPLVNSDNEITMQIALLNDEQNGEQTIEGAGTNGGDLTVPRITTREILTTATVPNGNTIVLGGLIINRGGSSKSGIPILGDIPYLGRLFSTKSNDNDRSELMVFIQPSIVSNTENIDALQADMDARYQVSDEARFFTAPEESPPPAAIPVVDPNAKPAIKPKASSSSRPSIRPAHRR